MNEERSVGRRRPIWLAIWLLAVFVAGLSIMSAGSTRPAHAATESVEVDPLLREQLAANPAGGVAAVITTWEYAGLDAVTDLGIQGSRLTVLPMLLTKTLTQAQLDALVESPAVRSVYANHSHELLMEDTTWIIRARETWQAVEEGGLGITGAAVHIAVIDTGADGMHEDMDNLVEFCETQQALTNSQVTVLCSPFDPASGNAGPAGTGTDPRLDSTDDNGHGSHVSGTIAGSGDASGGREAYHSTIGVAPDARLHVYSANIGPSLANHEILASYDDLIRKKLNGFNDVVAVSNSWGGGTGGNYSPADPQQIAFETAYHAGILSVFAAGNSGPEHNTLSRQCVNPFVVCVAASTKNDSVVMFSSRGRPSEPADTNRDGVVGGQGDVPPDNHDRALGQALGLGLYRPTLTAPGVNIFAISANALTCREGPLNFDIDCYVAFNGTSMATPHVSGVVALITQAYREGHGGANPTPAEIIDILERSANVSKLPGYEAEEQGAGRLNARTAAEFALTYPAGLPPVNWGTATPPYAADAYPGAPAVTELSSGCTSDLSWSAPTGATGPRYGQHLITVSEDVERLRLTINWPEHQSANLYARLWRPGVDPDAETAPAGPDRVFPDQESLGLLHVGADVPIVGNGTMRWLDVRAPEAGTWTLRVYHRAGGVPATCDPASAEQPKQLTGFNYDLKIEQPVVADTPTAAITEPHEGDALSGRFVDVAGTAAYPPQWDGVTRWHAPGSGNPATMPAGPDDRLVLQFQGNVEEGCTGDGRADLIACGGPFLIPAGEAALSDAPPAHWTIVDPIIGGTADRTPYDPSWIWELDGATTVAGPMTVEFWASCGGCSSAIGLSADWFIRLWADGVLVQQQRLTAPPLLPNVPQKLELTVGVPPVTAASNLVLHVDPVYIDSQANTIIYYDSNMPCPGGTAGSCDSIVRMPVGGGTAEPGIPQQPRTTDLHDALRLAWEPAPNATAYTIYRSTDPDFDVTTVAPLATTAGTPCDSPDAPSWPSASRSGLCFTDTNVTPGITYYYRVAGTGNDLSSPASLLTYGVATTYDRQVKVGFDRLWGPRAWEYATLLDPAATTWEAIWDTLELDPDVTLIQARAFSQGIGSANASVQPAPPPPTDEVTVSGGGKVPGEVPPDEGVKEATFGFIVEPTAAGPTGDLSYRDHETGVRIKAVSFETLSVTGNSCTFSGQAEVRRNGATTVESFTVTCEDNGNPGAENDRFEIVTDTYSGGGILTGGNITFDND